MRIQVHAADGGRQGSNIMKRAFLVALALSFAGGAAWAASSVSMPSMWRYAHPDAKALIGIEWQRILRSPLGQEIRKKITEANPAGVKEIDILDSVGRIFISSPGRPEGTAEGEQAQGVAAIQGDFDLGKIRKLASAKTVGTSTYQEIKILELADKDGEPAALALVSPQLLLLGDKESVEAAIDHYLEGDPAQASNPLFQRAAELSAQNDIWVVAKAAPGDFAGKSGKQPKFLESVRSVEAGISLQDGLGLQLNLGATDAEKAQEMATGLKFMLGMVLASQQSKGDGPNLAEKLHVETKESRVEMALHLKQDEVKQLIENMKAKATAAIAGGGAAVGSQPAPGANGGSGPEAQSSSVRIWGTQHRRRPAGDGKIRIYNVEGGTKVIELKP